MAKIKDAHKRILKEKFEEAANQYLAALLQKWGWRASYGFWVGDEIGGVYAYGDCDFINYDDMRYVVDNDITYKSYDEWQEYLLQAHEFNLTTPNLDSWVKGCPKASKEELEHLQKLKDELDEECNNLKEKF